MKYNGLASYASFAPVSAGRIGDKCSPRESAASRGDKKASQADDETRLTIWAVLIARCPLRKVLYHSKLHMRQIKNNDYDATGSSPRTPAQRGARSGWQSSRASCRLPGRRTSITGGAQPRSPRRVRSSLRAEL